VYDNLTNSYTTVLLFVMINIMMKYVAYYRVSTDKQGDSGLGLDAQKTCIADYSERTGSEVISSYTDILSGKSADRPELQAALTTCELTGATLIVSKLDRLSRDVEFVAKLLKSSIKFVCCDMDNADKTTLQVMAVMAERERELISRRTKEGLAAAKARGVKLGNPNLAAVRCTDTSKARATWQRNAADRNSKLLEIIQKIEKKEEGDLTLAALASKLNDSGFKTARGKAFSPMHIHRLKSVARA